ncbi:MAG: hypothetical protein ACK55Z_09770 [bacterium]
MHNEASEFEFLSIELFEEIVNALYSELVLFELLEESDYDVCDEELEIFVIADSSVSFPESLSEPSAIS